MDGMILLRRAKMAGLSVKLDGDRLRIRGPRAAETLAKSLLENKPAVVRALRESPRPVGRPIVSPGDLPADWRVEWEERAAVREIEGEQPREHAEAEAFDEILARMREAGELI